MPSVAKHYKDVLADVYSWMHGGFDAGIETNTELFAKHGIQPRSSGLAVDLGAGCGFQAIPLARAGFDVVAIDLDRQLLDELERHASGLAIRTVAGDLMNFRDHVDGPVELVVCMTDTLWHLESEEQVQALLEQLAQAIESGGRFVATIRDLSSPLEGLARFIPVHSDESRILTCFLEYEDGRVKVHDLLYQKKDDGWRFSKSYYYKLAVAPDRIRRWLIAAGFGDVAMTIDRGLATIVATN